MVLISQIDYQICDLYLPLLVNDKTKSIINQAKFIKMVEPSQLIEKNVSTKITLLDKTYTVSLSYGLYSTLDYFVKLVFVEISWREALFLKDFGDTKRPIKVCCPKLDELNIHSLVPLRILAADKPIEVSWKCVSDHFELYDKLPLALLDEDVV